MIIIIIIVLAILVVGVGGGIFLFKVVVPKFNDSTETVVDNGSKKKNKFTIVDPMNHKITIVDDDIYIKEVELSYLYREAESMRETASVISDDEIEQLTVTDMQKYALTKAASYFKSSQYSKKQLIEGLEYESIPHDAAVFAAENCKADWKEQATITAKTILAAGGYTEEELEDSLRYYYFTDEEIEYALKNVNADYYEQAVYDACFYKYNSGLKYDKATAKERLESSGYSDKAVSFAIKTVYEKLK